MRILLAEDDATLSARLREDLHRRGYAVDVADNGVDAEHLGAEQLYDAVILDLGLPQRPGLDVLRSWRVRGNTVPVLILTARDAWHEIEPSLCRIADIVTAQTQTQTQTPEVSHAPAA